MKALKTIKSKALAPGDTVKIIAPSSPFEKEHLEKGVLWLKKMGFEVSYNERIFEKTRYLAGSHKNRADEINSAFADSMVKAIVCARGGYGAIGILPFLDLETIKKNSKIFLGCSDVTVILNHITSKTGLVTFHGPMVASLRFAKGPTTLTENFFMKTLMTKEPVGEVRYDGMKVLKEGKGEGQMIGGCLSLLVTTLGTPYEIDTKNKILFIEDIGEQPYRIERMLMHLKMASKLKEIKGIIFGDMEGCQPKDDKSFSLEDIILDVFTDIKAPILFGFPSGHSFDNITIPFGVNVRVDGDEGKILILENGVL